MVCVPVPLYTRFPLSTLNSHFVVEKLTLKLKDLEGKEGEVVVLKVM